MLPVPGLCLRSRYGLQGCVVRILPQTTIGDGFVLVLIDESGDPGFKLTSGSTPYFVMAMVIFRDYRQAELASQAIQEARTALRVTSEFKFNKCCDVVRDGFFEAVQPFKFGVRAIIVDKSSIYSHNLRTEPERFYSFFLRLLMDHDGGALVNARIKIDGSGDRQFKRELTSYLRRQLGPGKMDNLRFVDSHKDALIQLADMVAGAIGRSCNTDRKNHARWRKQLAPKIENVWPFR